ncbi:MAG: squalene/phytoene synthase family protein [Bacteroidetes bacterium]|nr:squalene/phytoene synthase family protein [Bacteroidota bacterium]
MNGYKEKRESRESGKAENKNSRSSFFYSFSLLPKEKNEAINTVYEFCRETDDIVDENNSSADIKKSRIQEWKTELEEAIKNQNSKFSLLNKVSSVMKKFSIPSEPFFDLIKGMELDIAKNRYNTFGELNDYCYKVASTVGLMSIEIFGYKNPKTKDFAVNLGIALQLTNILRDIKTDAALGRIYIPLEDLEKFNYGENELMNLSYNEKFRNLMKFECERAHSYYRKANESLTEDDKGLMFAARIMQHIYFRILKKIEKRNYNVFEETVKVSKLKKIFITAGVFIKYKLLYGFGEKNLAVNGK